jgi:hypothetical protein
MISLVGRKSNRLAGMSDVELIRARTDLLCLAQRCRQPAEVRAFAERIQQCNVELTGRYRRAGVRRPVKG